MHVANYKIINSNKNSFTTVIPTLGKYPLRSPGISFLENGNGDHRDRQTMLLY